MSRPLVVVLGATGLIGSSVLTECASRPLRVRAVARRPARPPAVSRADIEVRTADLTEPGAVSAAVEGADVVVHTVARIGGAAAWRVGDTDPESERINVGLMEDLVKALAGRQAGASPRTVIYAGAVTQAGTSTGAVIDGSGRDRPNGPYDRQKLDAERILLAADRSGSLRGISLRLPTVFGGGDGVVSEDKGVVSAMVGRALAGRPLTLWHGGAVVRDLLYTDDVARAFALAIDRPERLAGRHWPLGTGRGVPLAEVFGLISAGVAEHTGRPPVEIIRVPAPEYADAGDFRDLVVDASAFTRAVGWRPRVPLEEALGRMIRRMAATVDGGHR